MCVGSLFGGTQNKIFGDENKVCGSCVFLGGFCMLGRMVGKSGKKRMKETNPLESLPLVLLKIPDLDVNNSSSNDKRLLEAAAALMSLTRVIRENRS